jgi:hypothetical protein
MTRRDGDHAPLSAAGAEKHAASQTEFTEPPSRIDPLKHGGYEGALGIGARRQLTRFEHGVMLTPERVLAQLFCRLQGIEYRAAYAFRSR